MNEHEDKMTVEDYIGNTVEKINELIKSTEDTYKFINSSISIAGDISDGYHTFNELYEHRTILFASICNMNAEIAWKSWQHADGTMYKDMFIAGITTNEGTATYHCESEYWDNFVVQELEYAPEFDGHTPEVALARIFKLCSTTALASLRTENLTFGDALKFCKNGYRITREGWNGKGLFVVYQKGYPEGIHCNKQTAEAWGLNEGDLFRCEPYLQINTVDGSHAMWVPSIRDCLADDWRVV